jgi:outer membrane lipoprotein carrier protein
LFRRLAALPLFFALTLGAQAPDVHMLAKQVDDHYNKLRSLRAGFTETYDGMGLHRSESGTLLLLKPGRMRWDYTSPAGKLFLIDGKYAWSYTRGASQVQRIAAKQLDDLRSPLSFLLGHTKLEKELENLQVSPGTHGDYLLTGQPKGQQNRIRQVRLAVTATGTITALEIEEQDGAMTRFLFSNEEPNAAAPDSAFRFVPPEGVPVVDVKPPV